jgi:hypothetical protein
MAGSTSWPRSRTPLATRVKGWVAFLLGVALPVVVAFLSGTFAITMAPPSAPGAIVAVIVLFGVIGLSQLAWVVPLYFWTRRHRYFTIGLVIGAGLVGLGNVAMWSMALRLPSLK